MLSDVLPPTRTMTLQASGAQTATNDGSSNAVTRIPSCEAIAFELDVTAAATDAGDLLDVFVQTTIDGTNYVDIAHFTQVLGNGGAKRYFTKVIASVATAEFENATALGAAAVRNLMGIDYRVRWTVTDAGTDNASWTFAVYATPM